ncbi:MAG: nucleotide-binding domain containing protein [Ruthenibacterium lactatiformans]
MRLYPGGGSAEGKKALVYEAQTNRDYGTDRRPAGGPGETGLLAGCAGFASVLPRLLQLSCRDTAPLPLCGRLLAVCGSISVSLEQCAQAEAQGAPRFSLTPEQKLSRDWAAGAQAGEMLGAVLRACSQEPVVVLDTGGAVENAGADKTADRIQIANTLGALLKRLLDDGLESTVLIMGGDCLLGLMRQLDVTEIMPLCEVAPGVVLSQFTYGGRQWNLVSKSGGFGAKTLFYDLQNILERWKKELPAV